MYITFINDSATKVEAAEKTYELGGHYQYADPLNRFLPNLTQLQVEFSGMFYPPTPLAR